jgi:hypothetical protein
MEGTTSSGVVTSDLSEVGMVLDCVDLMLVPVLYVIEEIS